MRNPATHNVRRRVLFPVLAFGATSALLMPMASVAVPITVPENPQSVPGVRIESWHGDRKKTPSTIKTEYQVGENVVINFRVHNQSNKTIAVTPVETDAAPFAPPAPGNCRWGALKSPNQYSCDSPRHLVTTEDKERGFFNTDSTWDITPQGETTTRIFVPGVEINVGPRTPKATVTVEAPTYQDANSNNTVDAGDTVTLAHTIANTGNVTLTKLSLGGQVLDNLTLKPGQESKKVITRPLTDEEILAKRATPLPSSLEAHNGKLLAVTTQAEAPAPLTLDPASSTPGSGNSTEESEGNSPEGSGNESPGQNDPGIGSGSSTSPGLAPYTPAARPEGGYEEQLIVNNYGGPDKLKNYRIPALIQLNNGHILISYDGRPNWGDAPEPNWIIQQRSVDGGKTFQTRTIINQGRGGAERVGYSDPSYVYDAVENKLFNFHVYSKNVGFWASNTNDKDEDRNVISAIVAVSSDNGVTWTNKSVTSVIKAGGIGGVFATSGNGIQKRFAPHQGRLIQPFVVIENGVVRAVMLYSDDHGETWVRGATVGSSMDENKVVELSDGRLMLNSRVSNRDTWRVIAISDDGGQTWGPTAIDHTLIDPRNNASLIQMNPNAAQGSRQAKELLFSNAASKSGRVNGSVRYSCDDGQTWPVVKVYRPGAHAYSDLAALKDGTFGVFFEAENDSLWFGRFTREWLNPFCAHFADAKVHGDAGQNITVPVEIRNDDERPLPAGRARIHLENGWTSDEVDLPALDAGQTATVNLTVNVPDTAIAGVHRGEVRVQADSFALRGDVELTVVKGAPPKLGAEIKPSLVDSTRDVSVNPYQAGEEIRFNFFVKSTSSVPQTISPAQGNLRPFLPEHGKGNCRWRNLAAGAQYNCNSPKYTVTAEDVARGYIQADTVWTVEAAGFETLRQEIAGPEVPLKVRTLNAELAVESTSVSDANADGYHEVGDTVSVTVKAKNTSNVTADFMLLTHAGEESDPTESVSESNSVSHTWTHVLTQEDLAAGAVTLNDLRAYVVNGSIEHETQAVSATVTLNVKSANPVVAAVSASPTSVRVGDTFTITGTGFTPGAQLRLELHSEVKVLGTTEASTEGAITFEATVPQGVEVGEHTVKVFAEGTEPVATTPLTVVAPTNGTGEGGQTGDNTGTGDGGQAGDNTGTGDGGQTGNNTGTGGEGNGQQNGSSSTDGANAGTGSAGNSGTADGTGSGKEPGSSSAGQEPNAPAAGTGKTVENPKTPVAAKVTPSHQASLAKTGSTALTILAIGALTLGLGAAFLFLRKK